MKKELKKKGVEKKESKGKHSDAKEDLSMLKSKLKPEVFKKPSKKK